MEVRSEPFAAVGLHKTPTQSQPPMQSMRLTFASDGTSIYKHVPSGPADAAREPAKRKRGRPRKYGSDGGAHTAAPSALLHTVLTAAQGGRPAELVLPVRVTGPAGQLESPEKKSRGRPPGSGKKQQMNALGGAGTGFTPHVLIVKTGEDVSSVIMSSLQHESRAVCILSANGAISNVTLHQAATSGGTVTYEGRFEILSISGSFMFSEIGGQRSVSGGLSVSLAGPDGRVLGGGVAGLLTAASPVQVVIGSFIINRKKQTKDISETGFRPKPLSTSNAGASSPPSRGTVSESSGGAGTPTHQTTAYNNGNPRPIASMPSWK